MLGNESFNRNLSLFDFENMSKRKITKSNLIGNDLQPSSTTSNSGNRRKSKKNLTDDDKRQVQPEISEDEETTGDENEQTNEDNNESDEEVNKHTQSSHDSPYENRSTPNDTREPSSSKSSSTQKLFSLAVLVLLCVLIKIYLFPNDSSDSSSNNIDWRLKVDPNNTLSNKQQSIIRASLKPILDKSSTRQDEGVSTLLILSSNEESASKLARCLLGLVNKKTNKDQLSTEIDLLSHRGGKLSLDSNLQILLNTTDAIRAVLLRHIDYIQSNDALERIRLLFAYCDGENPVIPHRLILMTATSNSENENELRESFKTRWPDEHDFIDALMSRISGHTLYVQKDQKSIC